MQEQVAKVRRVALVTGCGSESGIGFATARRLFHQMGCNVVITSTTDRIHRRAEELRSSLKASSGAEEHEQQAASFVADLTKESDVDALVRFALDKFGGVIDILVNNAGMVQVGEDLFYAPLAETRLEDWLASLNRNMTTTFLVTKRVLSDPSVMPEGGRVVNVASTSGAVQADSGDVGYHASKAGLIGLTRTVALEFSARKITVNAVAPGWIGTSSQSSGEVEAGDVCPWGRSGTPDETAAVIAFLCSPDASYVTGQMYICDGGNSLPEDRRWMPKSQHKAETARAKL